MAYQMNHLSRCVGSLLLACSLTAMGMWERHELASPNGRYLLPSVSRCQQDMFTLTTHSLVKLQEGLAALEAMVLEKRVQEKRAVRPMYPVWNAINNALAQGHTPAVSLLYATARKYVYTRLDRPIYGSDEGQVLYFAENHPQPDHNHEILWWPFRYILNYDSADYVFPFDPAPFEKRKQLLELISTREGVEQDHLMFLQALVTNDIAYAMQLAPKLTGIEVIALSRSYLERTGKHQSLLQLLKERQTNKG